MVERLPAYVKASKMTTLVFGYLPARRRTKWEPIKPAPPQTITTALSSSGIQLNHRLFFDFLAKWAIISVVSTDNVVGILLQQMLLVEGEY
jgi:hypothetical protein